MKYWLAVVILSMSKPLNCSDKKQAAIPPCIQQKIDAAKAAPKANPPIEVQQYTYQGRTVYLVSSGCCDQYNTVYDEQCHYICAPSGGFTGKGDGKCPDFAANATLVKTVWKDDR